jgi:hypothetical protein
MGWNQVYILKYFLLYKLSRILMFNMVRKKNKKGN